MQKSTDIAVIKGLARIREHMCRLVGGESPTYDCAHEIWATSFSLANKSQDIMWVQWLIWGELTDRWEMQSHPQDETEQLMVRAATEWLAVKTDDLAACKAYLDRWHFDELENQRE